MSFNPFISTSTKKDEESLFGANTMLKTEGQRKPSPFFLSGTGEGDSKVLMHPISSKSNSILLDNIPQKFYAREFLTEFYSKFGVVIKIDINDGLSNSAVITFVNHDSAEDAVQNGGILEDGEEPVSITFYEKKEIKPSTQQNNAMKITKHRKSFNNFKFSLQSLARNLSKRHCENAQAKYKVLDEIEVAIRKGFKRDRSKCKVLQGICMDMCSEKERYMREDRNQVSPYEIDSQMTAISDGNIIDHLKAVKEYSRSSADQDEPLPQELRPAPVLKMTMDFLIQTLIKEDLLERSDWFDFLWNRTRAIRKDIIQQNLKCMTSIELIEKCARFHILCSHDLCEQEMHVFDAKINLENLTKCLQTLKHMYEDSKKENMECLNEAEFRCYQILLNLNTGDTLREVMAFTPVVRNSTEVKFALKVFSAVHENNYIRFFKLLKEASFLSACLMHPYFTQIRASALKIMSRGFSVPKNDTLYPVDKIQEVLAFDDVASTQEFCNHYGFNMDETNIFFNRTSFRQPEESYPLLRSYIVASICSSSLAEVVNGSQLLPLPLYVPVNSFSSSGFYVGKHHEINDMFIDEVIDVVEEDIEVVPECVDKTDEVEIIKSGFVTSTEKQIISRNSFSVSSSQVSSVFTTSKSSVNPFLGLATNKSLPISFGLSSENTEKPSSFDNVSKSDQSNPFLGQSTANRVPFDTMQPNLIQNTVAEQHSSTANPGAANSIFNSLSSNENKYHTDNPFFKQSGHIANLPTREPFEIGEKRDNLSNPFTNEAINFSEDIKQPVIELSDSDSQEEDDRDEFPPKTQLLQETSNRGGVDPLAQKTVDLRQKLLQKRQAAKKDKADPEFIPTNKHFEEAVSESEEVDDISYEPRKPHVMILREDICMYLNEIIEDEIIESVQDILSEVFREIKLQMVDTEGVCNQLLALFCIQEARTTAVQVIHEEQSEMKRENSMILQAESKHFAEDLVDQHVHQTLKICCQDVHSEEIGKIDHHIYEKESMKMLHDTTEEIIKNEVQRLATETLIASSSERKEQLLQSLLIHQKQKLHKFFNRWTKNYKYHVFLKMTLKEFPTQPPLTTTNKVLQYLEPRLNEYKTTDMSKVESHFLLVSVADELRQKNNARRQSLNEKIQLEKILYDVLHENLNTATVHSSKCLNYRLVMRCPSGNTDELYASSSKVTEKIQNSYNITSSDLLVHQSSVYLPEKILANLTVKASAFDNMNNIVEKIALDGMLGLLYMIKVPVNSSERFWQDESKHLQALLSTSHQKTKLPMTVLIFSHGDVDRSFLNKSLHVDLLKDGDLISECKFEVVKYMSTNPRSFNNKVEEIFKWLLTECKPVTPVLSKQLATFVEDGMATLFFQVFHETCLYCNKLDLPSPDPVDVIALYNDSLDIISTTLLHSEYTNHDRIYDSCYTVNDKDKLKDMSYLIKQLKLPQLPEIDLYDWKRSHSMCLEYVSHLSLNEPSILCNRINALLRRMLNTATNKQQQISFPWAEVLEYCIINRLSTMYSISSTGKSKTNFQSVVHIHDELLKNISICNPLKSHIKKHNSSKYSLESSPSYKCTLKRRKYSREHSLRDSIGDITAQLQEIEESVRRRKTRSRSTSLNTSMDTPSLNTSMGTTSPLRQLLDDTMSLCYQVNHEKLKQKRDTSILQIDDEFSPPRDVKQREYPKLVGVAQKSSSCQETSQRNLTLESSVMECLQSIEESKSRSRSKLEYWKMVLDK